jgi:cellulose biosynthesis protein BcsQ
MSMMITIANRKGGVGKTTLAIALAETFVFEHKKNTVILDLDPQSSATEILLSVDEYADRLEADNVLPGYLRSALAGLKRPAEKFLSHARHSLNGRGSVDMAIVPNSPEMWDAEFAALRAGSEAQYREAMRALFDHLQTEFDVIIVDNPPGKTMASEEAILASDVVLCPIVPERLSVWGMDRMKAYFEELERTQTVPPWRFVISRLGGNYAEANKQVDVIKARYQDHFLTERKGLPGFGHTELVGLPQAQRIVQRIAMFRESPDTVKTLEGFYGADATQQLRKIAQKLQEVPEAHA